MATTHEAYRRYSPGVPLRLAFRALCTRPPLRKLSLLNRQRDYLGLAGDPALLALHHRLHTILDRAASEWPSHDYGEGYFYQSLSAIGVRGLRDTAARVAAMDLARRVAGRRVLEIGCNTGFLSLSIAANAGWVEGFDVNPFLVEVASTTANHLGATNVCFGVSAFESRPLDARFDVVLSFANHSTYDGNTRQSLGEYFDRCHALVEPGGWLLFESHPPAHEGSGLERVLALVADRFRIEEHRVIEDGTFLDRGRTFVAARRV